MNTMNTTSAMNQRNTYAASRSVNRHARLTFGGSLKAELIKLWSLNSTKWLLGITIAVTVSMAALSVWAVTLLASIDPTTAEVAAEPQPLAASDMWSMLAASGSASALVVAIFGVMAITSEYTTSSVQSSLVANPRRGMFYTSKSLAVALFTLLASVVGILLAWGVMTAMTGGYEVTALAGDERRIVPVVLVGFPVAMMLVALLAQGLGGLTRSTVGGVCAVVGLLMILSSVVSIVSLASSRFSWLGSVAYCLPDSALNNFLTAGIRDSVSAAIPQDYWVPQWWQSGLILLAWTVVAWGAGLLVTRRADVK
ncbi:Permease of ABC transporter system [Bifidobacterium lemurum]|uniref:Permease of ABC transporter system n=1 Tax=Bifidobacterium lemurum TaxID=1603886 RepID=A0A261FRT2_9BIFI|nr:permease of ABC transporter system [Bifidobacterium lemurum]OZG61900.1 Permease of ABC transporter system [Bifidobacterium lemurum]QOL33306.1 permease of ABC transporter system [Bifidobacterium lemurum]